VSDAARTRLTWLAAGLAAAASLAFAFGTPEHAGEGWALPGFFVAVATIETAVAIVLVGSAGRIGPSVEPALVRAVVVGGAAVSGLAVTVYLLTLPAGGSHAGHDVAAAAGPRALDLVVRVLELALVAVLIALAVANRRAEDGAVTD